MPPTPFRVQTLDHVELFVPDRREAAAWYQQILGLEILPEHEDWAEDPQGPLMISSDGGRTMLALFSGEHQGARPTAGFHRVAFRVDGPTFLAFLDRLAEVEVFDPDGRRVEPGHARDHTKAFSIYFCDPWGHRLEVTTYDHAFVAGQQPV
jgi:catechol 2,3-dioxygenase-like lactoylglutathione lyase family enzyme